jgi:hypothetical protein
MRIRVIAFDDVQCSAEARGLTDDVWPSGTSGRVSKPPKALYRDGDRST